MPPEGEWATVRDFLVHSLPRLEGGRVDEMLRDGGVVDMDGPVGLEAPYVPGGAVWFHRDLPSETTVPFDIAIVHRDENLVVIDKPHFLATIPRGAHILQSALVRLRHQLNLPDLIPAHRLDRVTAGLVLFVADPARRGAYQTLFQDRKVRKEYLAVAPKHPQLNFPVTVTSRIVKAKGEFVAHEIAGEPNAETTVELLGTRGDLGLYRLLPRTGRTHQLRLHMNSLGIAILGEDLYPTATDRSVDDFTCPLQLLAAALEFTDPLDGSVRRFESGRTLQAWDSIERWSADDRTPSQGGGSRGGSGGI